MTAGVEGLWEEFGEPLRRFVLKRVRNRHDADDVLQEVFLKAHAGLGELEDRDRARPWLYRIAANAIADHYRNRRTAPEPLEETAAQEAEEATGREDVDEEVLSCLPPMIADLPEGYRRALVLADLEGKTQREVAEELGLSLSGAKSRVQRARGKLKATLLSCCRIQLDRVGNVLDCRRKEKASRCCS
jgi:RNA polymerase sigma-70 factor (ECF subfamily)